VVGTTSLGGIATLCCNPCYPRGSLPRPPTALNRLPQPKLHSKLSPGVPQMVGKSVDAVADAGGSALKRTQAAATAAVTSPEAAAARAAADSWRSNAVEASGKALGQGAAVTIEWSGWALSEARQRLSDAAQSERAQQLKARARRQATVVVQRGGLLAKQAAEQAGKGAQAALAKAKAALQELRTPPAGQPPADSAQ
jgi:hypothetical protein